MADWAKIQAPANQSGANCSSGWIKLDCTSNNCVMCTGQPAISHKSSTKAALQDLIFDKIRGNCKIREREKKACLLKDVFLMNIMHQELQSLYCFNLDMTQSNCPSTKLSLFLVVAHRKTHSYLIKLTLRNFKLSVLPVQCWMRDTNLFMRN